MKLMSCGLAVLATFLVFSGISQAGEEFVFPVGIWVTEDLRRTEEHWPFDIAAGRLVDLRSKGVEMILLNGWYSGKKWYQIQGNIWFDSVMVDVAVLREKLARADSFGFLVYADPKSIDQTLKYWGHDPEDTLKPYFRMDDNERFTTATFQDTLGSLVSWVVDSLNTFLQANDIQSLYRYIFWDEPFSKHVRAVRDTLSPWEPWDDYWRNIWHHDDTTGWSTDTLGVYTFLKHKIEKKDSLHSVWINLGGSIKWHTSGKNSERGLCSLQVIPYGDTVHIPNPPHQFSFDAFPFGYGTEIGDTSRVRERWTAVIDTIVGYAKSVDQNKPPPVYATQLQSFGSCNLDTFHWKRITIPEEVKELANLAVLHEVKGIMHFVLYSFAEKGDCWANLWDDDQVPFDAPYEEYVYNRDHDYFSDPDSLQPFNPDDPIHDPFRDLPPRPEDSLSYHKYLEHLYQWKYAPYARNYNALGEVNNQLHIIGNELLNLWKTQSLAVIIWPDSSGIVPPEVVTFSPTDTIDKYLFFVNKDLRHSEMGFTVKIMRYDSLNGEEFAVPLPPHLRSAHVLDLSERHLISRTVGPVYITFRMVLGAGEGKLVRLVEGTEAGDAMLADPDVRFYLVEGGAASTVPQHEFTEGDTIRLYATVYNLGFSPLNNLSVSFYDGHVDPSNLIRTKVVNLPALDTRDTLPAMAIASWDWYASDTLISVHDINVQAVASGPGEEREENNHGHMALLIHPEDYATAVVGDPWDMTEKQVQTPGEPSTADIDSFQDFTETPDSISGVWEAEISTLISQPDPKVYLHLPDSIDGSKYNQFSVRFTQIPSTGEGYVKIGWLASDMTSGSDSALYTFNQWNIEEFDWSNNAAWVNKQISTLWVHPDTVAGTQFRLAWVKLTTEP